MKNQKSVLEAVVEEARCGLKAWRAYIALIPEEGKSADLIAAGFENGLDTSGLIGQDGISDQVMASGEPWYVEDARDVPDVLNPAMLADGVKAAACAPLSLGGHNIGVMWIHYKESRQFLPADIEALQLYANLVANAYDAARLTQQLEHLRLVADRLTSKTDAKEVLQQATRSVLELHESSACASICLLEGKGSSVWRHTIRIQAAQTPLELRAFDREDPKLLESLASQAAMALENARAYKDLPHTKLGRGVISQSIMAEPSSLRQHTIDKSSLAIPEQHRSPLDKIPEQTGPPRKTHKKPPSKAQKKARRKAQKEARRKARKKH